MSSPGYTADAQAMTRAVQGFEECSANAKKTMSNLENDLVSALSHYQGSQAVSFWNLHTQLQEKMRVASNELDTMSNLVNQSFHNYGSGDATVSQSLNSLSNTVDAGGAVLGRLSGGSALA
ncbi:WXG100 family type VII secretion target [Kutzneria viridogrisea]|uniref:Uncharacterized protein n=2 Tax=Kutzneria TaxID=43356 RepID=W5WF85_9PSEU|nr:hypothetical protein [Kutzneria albida]AHH99420.1 hypothetical protein KALB_6060 [Kutzneria albida DSM 43870]MBA8923023.1 uncharacterized protein YukE [Kutzneria viridogrisea]